MAQEKKEPLLQGYEELVRFKVPEAKDIEIFLIKLKDGRVVARTKDEIEELKK